MICWFSSSFFHLYVMHAGLLEMHVLCIQSLLFVLDTWQNENEIGMLRNLCLIESVPITLYTEAVCTKIHSLEGRSWCLFSPS